MTKTLFVSIIGLLCAGIIVSSAHAQTDPVGGEAVKNTQSAPISAAACATPEFRQLDFWLGDWDLSWPLPTGETGHGTNIITKSPFGDCVIKETFDGAPTQSYQQPGAPRRHAPVAIAVVWTGAGPERGKRDAQKPSSGCGPGRCRRVDARGSEVSPCGL